MVSKCLNPECPEKFVYFGSGELLVRTNSVTGRQELFWVCDRCAIEWHTPPDLVPLQPRSLSKRAAA